MYAPFASRQRRGYVRDASERDLAVHLETALRGIIISKRWPKSGLDVVITVLEGEEDSISGSEDVSEEQGGTGAWGIMSLLSGCITVASAAIADAGIDCVDLVTGGVAAIVRPAGAIAEQTSKAAITSSENPTTIVKDICPTVHEKIFAVCVVGYLQSRDEITEIWIKGDATTPAGSKFPGQSRLDVLIEKAIEAAMAARLVLKEALMESTELQIDFSAVGEITNLKPPAARMRFTRLRRAIEDGTLIDTHGKHFQGSSDKIAEAQKKRKRPSSKDADYDGDNEEPESSRPRKKASRSPGVRYEAESCNAPCMGEGEISSPEDTHMDTEYQRSIESRSSDSATENIDYSRPPADTVAWDLKEEAAEEAQRHVLPSAALLTNEQ
ncbi:MAG: hypothetical protein Q9191_000867 [Dirinaria sp. TL-2023a]